MYLRIHKIIINNAYVIIITRVQDLTYLVSDILGRLQKKKKKPFKSKEVINYLTCF